MIHPALTSGLATHSDVTEMFVVAPGFIDMHSHSDTTMLSDPGGDSKAYKGVTTKVTGNCGSSPFPVASKPRRCRVSALDVALLLPERGMDRPCRLG